MVLGIFQSTDRSQRLISLVTFSCEQFGAQDLAQGHFEPAIFQPAYLPSELQPPRRPEKNTIKIILDHNLDIKVVSFPAGDTEAKRDGAK